MEFYSVPATPRKRDVLTLYSGKLGVIQRRSYGNRNAVVWTAVTVGRDRHYSSQRGAQQGD